MSYILNIHTTTENAIVNLCEGPNLLKTLENQDPKKHASFLHVAIERILDDSGVRPKDLSAVAVTGGPGSYTGIRLGLATAKGLCFALDIPLIVLNTLEVMGRSLVEIIKDQNALYCPMIDARRMEVFSAVYNYQLKEIIPPSAFILSTTTFHELAAVQPIYFSGSGIQKFKQLHPHINDSYFFHNQPISSLSMGNDAWTKFQKKEFENVENASPVYLKEFYTIERNK